MNVDTYVTYFASNALCKISFLYGIDKNQNQNGFNRTKYMEAFLTKSTTTKKKGKSKRQ